MSAMEIVIVVLIVVGTLILLRVLLFLALWAFKRAPDAGRSVGRWSRILRSRNR